METVRLANFPVSVHIALFRDVSNAAQLRKRIILASTAAGPVGDVERGALNFAFIEAKLVASRKHLLTAVYQSLLSESHRALKTKTVHSEIIWSLNPTNNITEALRRFGVSDQSTSLLVIHIADGGDQTDVEHNMKAVVEGRLVALEELPDIVEWTTIAKCYKVFTDPVLVKEVDPQRRCHIINELVTSVVAIKSVAS